MRHDSGGPGVLARGAGRRWVSPRSRDGPAIRCPAWPSTGSRSPPTSGRRCAGWPTSSALPLSSLLLAAHAKVLAALAGEREVATGYVPAAGDRPLPCRLTHRTRHLARC